MARQNQQNPTWKGYGSSYAKKDARSRDQSEGLDAVLGGQVWRVKPDEEPKTQNPCLWMQAGVVKFKTCNNFYDCTTCKYDQGMQKKVGEGKQTSWQEAMRRKPELERTCRHTLTQRIGHRLCAYDYQCSSCDFDQYFEDYLAPQTPGLPPEIHQIRGFDVPVGYYFHRGHTWARIESGGYLRIGMDDFALKVFGEMDRFELPLMGNELDQSRPGWDMERKGNRAEVLAPVGGIICEVNTALLERPAQANQGPYEEGWMFLVRHPNLKKAMENLMSDTDSMEWTKQEVRTLESLVEEVSGPMAADGGVFGEDIYGSLPELDWSRLSRTFLHKV
ncbi:MAG: hypothetical protein K9K39_05505 [Desulfohalobiaceae bacterium]|nr:hypothetical protein [Desulfohalobiaceae bacterium]